MARVIQRRLGASRATTTGQSHHRVGLVMMAGAVQVRTQEPHVLEREAEYLSTLTSHPQVVAEEQDKKMVETGLEKRSEEINGCYGYLLSYRVGRMILL